VHANRGCDDSISEVSIPQPSCFPVFLIHF
jgi:hypothetical protein